MILQLPRICGMLRLFGAMEDSQFDAIADCVAAWPEVLGSAALGSGPGIQIPGVAPDEQSIVPRLVFLIDLR